MGGAEIVGWALMPLIFIDVAANILLLRAIPRSHKKYVLASVRSVTVLALPLTCLVNMADDLAGHHEPWELGLHSALLIMSLWVAKSFYDRGDDNWFKGAGRRFRRRWRTFVAPRGLAQGAA